MNKLDRKAVVVTSTLKGIGATLITTGDSVSASPLPTEEQGGALYSQFNAMALLGRVGQPEEIGWL